MPVNKKRSIGIIILAAGKSSRMKSRVHKVLHDIAGQAMLEYVLQVASCIESLDIAVVCSNDLLHNERFVQIIESYKARPILQTEPLGTAHAVLQGIKEMAVDDILILYGDVPFLNTETIKKILDQNASTNSELTLLGFHTPSPNEYGKIVVEHGKLTRIVENKNATAAQQEIELCNSGILLASSNLLHAFLNQMKLDSISGEYYLTDIVSFAAAQDYRSALIIVDAAEVVGINNMQQLARAERIMQERIRHEMVDKGVKLIAPETVFFTRSVKLEADVVVHPYVCFGRDVEIGAGSEVLPFSHIEGAKIGTNCVIGPFARIRPKSEIAPYSKIGNFVELKNVKLGRKVKASHLSYIGDASIGESVNIGAGAVFCNYDGKMKHHSTVAAHSFIGANSSIISPVIIGSDSIIGAGSVIAQDVPDGMMAIARKKQVNIPKKRIKS